LARILDRGVRPLINRFSNMETPSFHKSDYQAPLKALSPLRHAHEGLLILGHIGPDWSSRPLTVSRSVNWQECATIRVRYRGCPPTWLSSTVSKVQLDQPADHLTGDAFLPQPFPFVPWTIKVRLPSIKSTNTTGSGTLLNYPKARNRPKWQLSDSSRPRTKRLKP
jgi:hypothetical protein